MPGKFAHLDNSQLYTKLKESKDPEVFTELLERGKKNPEDALLHNRIGICYMQGVGTPINDQKAKKHYLKAAEFGNGFAMGNLGTQYVAGKYGPFPDFDMAAYWYLRASKEASKYNERGDYTLDYRMRSELEMIQAHDNSKAALGICYLKGYLRDLPQDSQKGVSLLTEAADKKSALAMFGLAQAYLSGRGIDQNPETAMAYIFESFKATIENPQWLTVLSSYAKINIPLIDNLFLSLVPADQVAENQDVNAEQLAEQLKEKKLKFMFSALIAINNLQQEDLIKWEQAGIDLPIASHSKATKDEIAALKLQKYQSSITTQLLKTFIQSDEDKKLYGKLLYSLVIARNVDGAIALRQFGVSPLVADENNKNILHAVAVTPDVAPEKILQLFDCLSSSNKRKPVQDESLSEEAVNKAMQKEIEEERKFFEDLIFSNAPNALELAMQSQNSTLIIGFLAKLGIINKNILNSKEQFDLYRENLDAYITGREDKRFTFKIAKDNKAELNKLAMAAGDINAFYVKIAQLKENISEENNQKLVDFYLYIASAAHFDSKHRAQAYAELSTLAETPDAPISASYAAAQCLEFGHGVDKNPQAAKALYEKVKAQNEDLFAQKTAARYQEIIEPLYRQAYDKDDKQAFAELLMLAEHDYPDDGYTESKVGTCYYNGKGTSKDQQTAYNYYLRANTKGCRAALHNLGLYYYNLHDIRNAFDYWLMALNRGDEVTYNFLWDLSGKSDKLANFLLSVHCLENTPDKFKQIHFNIIYQVQNVYNEHFDSIRSTVWGPAYYYLAKAYHQGLSTDCNLVSAIEKYSSAANYGYNEAVILNIINEMAAQENLTGAVKQALGKFYCSQGIKANDVQARFEYYLRAVSFGYKTNGWDNAANKLAISYYHGTGTDKDIPKTAFWRLKAIESAYGDIKDGMVAGLEAWYIETDNPHFAAALAVHYLNAYGHTVLNPNESAFELLSKPGVSDTELGRYGWALYYNKQYDVANDEQKPIALLQAISNYYQAAQYNSNLPDGYNILSIQALERLAQEQQPSKKLARIKLAQCYEHGYSVPVNLQKAFDLYSQLAELPADNDYSAMLYLANCYAEGKGCDKNTKLALEWCFKALEQMPTIDFDFVNLVVSITSSPEFSVEQLELNQDDVLYYKNILNWHVSNLSEKTFVLLKPLTKILSLLDSPQNVIRSQYIKQLFSLLNKPETLVGKLDNFNELNVPAVGHGSGATQADINTLKLLQLQQFLNHYVLMQLLPEATAADIKELQSELIRSIKNKDDVCALMLIKAGVSPAYEGSLNNNLLHIIANRDNLTVKQAHEYLQAFSLWAEENGKNIDLFLLEQIFSENDSGITPFEMAANQENYAVVTAFLFHLGLIDSIDIDVAEIPVIVGDLYSAEGGTIPKDLAKAVLFYEKAANQGNDVAMLKLAAHYLQEPNLNKEKAVEWYIAAANGNKANPARVEEAKAALMRFAVAQPPIQTARTFLAAFDEDFQAESNALRLELNQQLYNDFAEKKYGLVKKLLDDGAMLSYLDENHNNILHGLLLNAENRGLSNLDINEIFNTIDKFLGLHKNKTTPEAFYCALFAAKNSNEKSPLQLADETNNQAVKMRALEKLQWSPLHWKVHINDELGLKQFVSTGEYDVWAEDLLGRTPMQLALELNNWDCLRAALPTKALSTKDPNCKVLGEILIRAVHAGDTKAVDKLIELNAPVYSTKADKQGKYSCPLLLHIAAVAGNDEMVSALLKHAPSGKIDIKAKNAKGLTVIEVIAEEVGKVDAKMKNLSEHPTYDEAGRLSLEHQNEYASLEARLETFKNIQQELTTSVNSASSSWWSRMLAPKPKSEQVLGQPKLGSSAAKLEGYFSNI